jgi:hypothetical protein
MSKNILWFYPSPKPAEYGLCDWCNEECSVFEFKTSKKDKFTLCKRCVIAARKVSQGGFCLAQSTIPLLISWITTHFRENVA